jgi:DUF1009 family protein
MSPNSNSSQIVRLACTRQGDHGQSRQGESRLRFDVPVIGVETIRVAAEAKLRVIAIEARKTLLLEQDAIVDLANRSNTSIVAR